MKPAWQTTEFWITMLTNVFGVLVLLGVITPEQKTALTDAGGQLVGALLVIAPNLTLIIARIGAKKDVATAAIHSLNSLPQPSGDGGEVGALALSDTVEKHGDRLAALLRKLGL